MDLLKAALKIRDDEVRPVAWSAGFFFCVMCGWYLIRPLREAMGISRDVEDLPYLYLGTLGGTLIATPIFGLMVMRFRRRTFIAIVYRFFMLSLLGFVAAMRLLPQSNHLYVGFVFYVWVSIFNMFLVTLFWGFMADGFKYGDSKRIFGVISVGGSLGAIAGAGLTTQIADWAQAASDAGTLANPRLFVLFANLIIAFALLESAVQCMRRLGRVFDERSGEDSTTKALVEFAPVDHAKEQRSDIPDQGGAFAGIWRTVSSPYLCMVCLFLFLYTSTSTFVYFFQANIVAAHAVAQAERVQIFATIDFWVNIVTLAAELFITSRLLTRFGVAATLTIVPLITTLGFIALAAQPVLGILILFQVLRRGGWYGIGKPARETLFTVVSREAKYKAKSFIDTFVYRGGDALTATAFSALTAMGFGITAMATMAAPIGAVWALVGIYLGVKQRRLAKSQTTQAAFPVITPRV